MVAKLMTELQKRPQPEEDSVGKTEEDLAPEHETSKPKASRSGQEGYSKDTQCQIQESKVGSSFEQSETESCDDDFPESASVDEYPSKSEKEVSSPIEQQNKKQSLPLPNVTPPNIPKKPVFGSAAKTLVSFTAVTQKDFNFTKILEENTKPPTSLNPEASPFIVEESSYDSFEPVSSGEENEKTLFQARARLYIFTKDDQGTTAWKERGIGLVKINESKENPHDRRVLMRADGTFKLLVNARIFEGISFESADTKSIRVVLSNATMLEDNNNKAENTVMLFRFKGPDDSKIFSQYLACSES